MHLRYHFLQDFFLLLCIVGRFAIWRIITFLMYQIWTTFPFLPCFLQLNYRKSLCFQDISLFLPYPMGKRGGVTALLLMIMAIPQTELRLKSQIHEPLAHVKCKIYPWGAGSYLT